MSAPTPAIEPASPGGSDPSNLRGLWTGLPHTKSGNQMQKAQWLLIDADPGGSNLCNTKALHRLWGARGIPQNSETFF